MEVPAKRYRYAGMERDEESGLAMHGERYLMLHLGRWTRPDSEFDGSRDNRYAYASDSPVALVDTDGRREKTPEETNRLQFLRGLMDMEMASLAKAGTVWQVIDTALPGGHSGRYNTAEAHARAYEAAIARAGPGEPVYGWDIQNGGTTYYDADGHALAMLTGVPGYVTASEAAVARQDAVVQAGATSPISAVGDLIASAAGASEETRANVVLTGGTAWQVVSAFGMTAQASNAHNALNQSYAAERPGVSIRPTLPSTPRPPAIEALERGTGGKASSADVTGGLNWEPTVVFPGTPLVALGVAAKEGTPVRWLSVTRNEYIVTNQLVLPWYAKTPPARDPSGARTEGPSNVVLELQNDARAGRTGPVPFYLYSGSATAPVQAASSAVATQPGVGIKSPGATQYFTTAPGGFGNAVRVGGARYIVKGPLP